MSLSCERADRIMIGTEDHVRYAPVEDVRLVAAGQSGTLRLETPVDFNRLTPATVQRMVEWLASAARP